MTTTSVFVMSNVSIEDPVVYMLKTQLLRNSVVIVNSLKDLEIVTHTCCFKTKKSPKEALSDLLQCRHLFVNASSPRVASHMCKLFMCLGKYPSLENLKFFEQVCTVSMNKLPFVLYFEYNFEDERWSIFEKNHFIHFIDDPSIKIACIVVGSKTFHNSVSLLKTPNKEIPLIFSSSQSHFIKVAIDEEGEIDYIKEYSFDVHECGQDEPIEEKIDEKMDEKKDDEMEEKMDEKKDDEKEEKTEG